MINNHFCFVVVCSAESVVEIVGHLEVVNIARYVKALSQEQRRSLLIGSSKVKDKRTTRATAVAASAGTSDGEKKLRIDVEDASSRQPATHASIALKQGGFKDTTAEVLANLVMELMQDLANNKAFE